MNDDSSKYRVFDELQSVKAKYRELAEAAIAYDLAIQSAAGDPDKMSSFCTAQGDMLDSLYVRWPGLAMKAAGEPVAQVASHPTSKEDLQVAEEPKDWQKACPDYPNCPNLSCPCEPRSEQAVGDEVDWGLPTTDRGMLDYLMAAFDGESWQCPSCGHAEDTATMDSAIALREYLTKNPRSAVATAGDGVDYLHALDQADTALGIAGLGEDDIFRVELRSAREHFAALAQPRPMGGVPEAKTRDSYEQNEEGAIDSYAYGHMDGWNSCREAMLAAAPDVKS